MCLTIFAKIKFSRKFPNLQYTKLYNGPAGDGEHAISVGEALDEFEWPSLEARRDRSSIPASL